MRLTTAAAFSAFVSLVLALPNSFVHPNGEDETLTAGEKFVVEWSDEEGDKVNLYLKKGKSDNLKNVLTIAKNLSNQGAVRWAVPATLEDGDDYAIMIEVAGVKNDDDSGNSDDLRNYTGQFTIKGNKQAAYLATHVNSTSAAPSTSSIESTTVANSTVIASTSSGLNATTSATKKTKSTDASSTGSASSSEESASATASESGSGTSAAATSSGSTGAGSMINLDTLALAGGVGAALWAL